MTTVKFSAVMRKAMAWHADGVQGVCPSCQYDYSKLNYADFPANCVKFKQYGNEIIPDVDWFMECWPDKDLAGKALTDAVNNRPYLVVCLNCRHWLIYDPIKKEFTLTEVDGKPLGEFSDCQLV